VTLHPVVVADLLRVEANLVREALGDQFDAVELDGTRVLIQPKAWSGRWMSLDGAEYDQRPLLLAVLDADRKPTNAWPGSLRHGSVHLILDGPWACIRGTYQYHAYPGHAAETWDQFRTSIRLVHLVKHVLKKAAS